MKLSLSSKSIFSLLILGSQSANAFVSPLRQHHQVSGIKEQRFSTTSISSATLNEPTTATLSSETEENEISTQKTYLDDGFVFGLEGSGLSRPKGKVSQIVVEGDSLETQPYQVAAVSLTFINHALVTSLAMSQLLSLNDGNVVTTAVQAIVCILSSWVLADLGSGVLHWSVDNYGNGKTPIMGSIIAAFQGHHSAPWTITEREMCNNIYKLCVPFGIPTVGLIALLAGPSNPLGKIAESDCISVHLCMRKKNAGYFLCLLFTPSRNIDNSHHNPYLPSLILSF